MAQRVSAGLVLWRLRQLTQHLHIGSGLRGTPVAMRLGPLAKFRHMVAIRARPIQPGLQPAAQAMPVQ